MIGLAKRRPIELWGSGMNDMAQMVAELIHSDRPADGPAEPPSRPDIAQAFRSILSWIGENPDRDGLRDTPDRLIRAYQEYFAGYRQDPEQILQRTFEEVDGYDEMVVLRGIPFESHCEHHVSPIIGRAWVAYVPSRRVVGISKLARVVDAYAKRLQIQERLTAQIANTIEEVLKPQGVGVVIKAAHHCMSSRGIHLHGTDLVTSRMLGCFRDSPMTRQEFMSMVHSSIEK
jgi:GTP cyclohydrolase IA